MAITIWGRRSSFNVQKVLWLADELGLAYQHIQAGGSFGGLDEVAFRAMNPHGKVPVLRDGDVVVWESHAILRYLAARYGGAQWWPEAPGARVAADGWMDWAQTSLQPDFLMGVFWGWYRTPEADRDMIAVNRSLASCAAHMRLLDSVLAERPFLLGDALGLADIPAGVALYRYFEMAIERPQVPHVAAWYARLQARPGYRAEVMVPFGELFGRLAF
jgi:glutathione S-transferase